MNEIDPVLVAVIGNRLDAITKEIGQTMLRTSRSPIFAEARDFATAIFDRETRLVSQTHYIPVIGGSTPYSQRAIAEAFEGEINDGDVFVLNDPYRGNNHPPDIAITKPVFVDGKLCFWTTGKGHHADVGGGGVAGYNPTARDIWEEGLRIPPAKLVERGRLRRDMFEMIVSNVRLPLFVGGDLHCQIGAVTIGAQRVIALVEKYGVEVVYEVVEELLHASERQVRDEITNIPDGSYFGVRYMDNDGIALDKMVRICVKIDVQDSEITFDFTGSDPQTQGFLNSTYPNTVSSCHLALFSCLGPDVRYNEGATRPIHVIAPEGSVVNPLEPAPTTLNTVTTCETITEAIWLALSDVIPDKVQAPWARFCGPATMGWNPRTQRQFADIHVMGKGGGGATAGFDGWDHLGTIVAGGGSTVPDVEFHELANPYRILQYEYSLDSAGPGEWRGGLGVECSWEVLGDDISCANFGSGMLAETAPIGLQGGKGAPPYAITLTRHDGTTEDVGANSLTKLNRGDVFKSRSSGGGGFGDPRRRPVEKVLKDVRDEVVSIRAAAQDYGVAIDAQTLCVDEEETKRLREASIGGPDQSD